MTQNLQKQRLLKLATYASVTTALLLIGIKMVAWLETDSMSILAALIDSLLDAAASIINMIAIRQAIQPADKEHRFGHGKAESLAGLGQSLFIFGSAAFLAVEAFQRLLMPIQPQKVDIGIIVISISIVLTLILLVIQNHVIKKTGSTAIKADSLHYKSDLLFNVSVIIALLLSSSGWPGFDPLFALLIVIFIIFSAWSIANESIQQLMDRELPTEKREKIKAIVKQHPEVLGMHELRTRKSGTTSFIQLHLELNDQMSLIAAHTISDEVEANIKKIFPDAEVIIHEDPASLSEPNQF